MMPNVHLVLWFLGLLQTSGFAPYSVKSSVRKGTPSFLLAEEAHRNIIVLSHNVSEDVADGLFDVNNLLSGRVDVLTRCVNAALWVSNGIRENTSIYLMLFPHNITVEIEGSLVSGLNPDERTMALCLQRTLLAGNKARKHSTTDSNGNISRRDVELIRLKEKQLGRPQTINPNKPGSLSKSEKSAFRAARKQREAMVRRINRSMKDTIPLGFSLHSDDSLEARLQRIAERYKDCPILMLNEDGDPLLEVLQERSGEGMKRDAVTTTLILGDQIGYVASDEKLLAEHDAVRQVSLGPLSLLTSQCITITHHYLDTA